MELNASTALVIIDVQKALDEPEYADKNNPEYNLRIQDLLSIWRARDLPVFHVKHSSHDPLSPYFSLTPSNEFQEDTGPLPGEAVVTKEVSCAFINTALGSMLRMDGCEELIVCGAVTHNSVDATVRHASCLGFKTFVVEEACTAIPVAHKNGKIWNAEEVHELYLSVLDGEYAQVISIEDIFSAI